MAGNASDEFQDEVVTHTVSLLRLAAGEKRKVLEMLEQLEGKLVGDVAGAVGKTTAQIAKLQALLKQTQDTISLAYQDIAAHHGETLAHVAQIEEQKLANTVNAVLKVPLATTGMSVEQLKAIAGKTLLQGKYPAEWWDAQSEALRDKFAVAMREGMLKGETIDQLIQRVRGTKAKAYTDGIMQASKSQATALVRTSIITTANEARIASIKNAGKIMKGIQWVATLDSRTTLICQALDGKQWTVPEFSPVGHDKVFPGPTAHWQCRSTQIGVTRSWAELAGPKAKLKTTTGQEGNYAELLAKKYEAAGMTPEQAQAAAGVQKAKLDGNGTSGTLTFEKWLESKPDETVNQILGPGRAELWRTGKVSITEMTDQENRPLTIAELRKLVHAPPSGGEFTPLKEKPAPFKSAKQIKAEAQAAIVAEKEAEASQVIRDARNQADELSLAIQDIAATEPGLKSTEVVEKAKAQVEADKIQAAKAAQQTAEQHAAAQKESAEQAALDAQASARAVQKQADIDATEARAALYKAEVAEQAAQAKAHAQAAQQKESNAAAQAEMADMLADPTGKKGIVAQIAKLMKEQPGLEPAELLAQAKADAIAHAAKKALEGKLYGYKKAVVEGTAPSPSQKDAWEKFKADKPLEFAKWEQALADAQQAAKDAEAKIAAEAAAKLAEQQAAAAKAAADAAAAAKALADKTAQALADQQAKDAATLAKKQKKLAAPVKLPAPAGFPDDPLALRVIKRLSGSTGAELVEAPDGKRYVRKKGASPEHVREEIVADELYRQMGLNVPLARLYETHAGPVKLAEFIEGKVYGEYQRTASPAEQAFARKKLQEGFAADALLGNWDVLGADADNVLVDQKGEVWRIDNGGALRFRGMGGQKTDQEWNPHATELWTMRGRLITKSDLATRQNPHNTAAFQDLDFYAIARQIDRIQTAMLLGAPQEVRPILTARLQNLKDVARKALEYAGDSLKWKSETADEITRHLMGIRQSGITAAFPKALSQSGTTVLDENGLPFDHLRTLQGYTTPVQPPVAANDHYWSTIKTALGNYGYHGSSGGTLNEAKIKAATDLLPAIKAAAKAGDAMAQHYLVPLEELAIKAAAYGKGVGYIQMNPLKPYQPAATAKPAAPAQRAQSLVADLADYMAREMPGTSFGALETWMGEQASHSWRPESRAMKYWHFRNQGADRDVYFWGDAAKPGTQAAQAALKVAETQWLKLAKANGGEANTESSFRIYAAFVQEFLATSAFRFNDRGRRLVRLIRTEDQDVLKQHGYKVGDYAQRLTMRKSANESHSIYERYSLYGSETTVTAVPHHRITGLYFFERSPGATGGAFLGQNENEITANTTGLPASYTLPTTQDATKLDAGDPNDASTWRTPLPPGIT